MDSWVASTFRLMSIMLLWTWIYRCLFETLILIILGILGTELCSPQNKKDKILKIQGLLYIVPNYSNTKSYLICLTRAIWGRHSHLFKVSRREDEVHRSWIFQGRMLSDIAGTQMQGCLTLGPLMSLLDWTHRQSVTGNHYKYDSLVME